MTVDPTDPDTFEDDYTDESGPTDPEAPPEDSAEQRADLLRQHSTPLTGRGSGSAANPVNPADAAEQELEIEENEDEYR